MSHLDHLVTCRVHTSPGYLQFIECATAARILGLCECQLEDRRIFESLEKMATLEAVELFSCSGEAELCHVKIASCRSLYASLEEGIITELKTADTVTNF